MRTTLDIDEKLLVEVGKLTNEKSKSKAVNKALDEYVRWRKIEELRSLAGKIDLLDNWYEIRHMEPR